MPGKGEVTEVPPYGGGEVACSVQSLKLLLWSASCGNEIKLMASSGK